VYQNFWGVALAIGIGGAGLAWPERAEAQDCRICEDEFCMPATNFGATGCKQELFQGTPHCFLFGDLCEPGQTALRMSGQMVPAQYLRPGQDAFSTRGEVRLCSGTVVPIVLLKEEERRAVSTIII
jgi:hypothetical protein